MIRRDSIRKRTADFFTSDPEFVLWCLNPERDQDSYWSNYTEQHPQDLIEFKRAVDEVRHAAKARPALTADEKGILLDRIMTDYYARHFVAPKRRNRRKALLTAAAALVACIAIVLFWSQESGGLRLPSTDQYENITLLTHKGNREVYDDIASIQLTPKGQILINGTENAAPATPPAQTYKKTAVEMSELVVPKGKRAYLILSDSSQVWINSASVLRFPTTFSKTRDVYIEGEAYFEVRKDAKRPFVVHTEQFATHVLGTSFDVATASHANGSSAVVLVEGSVIVEPVDGLSVAIKPSQRWETKDGRNTLSDVDPYQYISWKDGLLFFTSNTLQEVLQKVATFYKVDISCYEGISGRKCTGKLILFDDLQSTLDVLSDIFGITYSHHPDGSITARPAKDKDPSLHL